MASVSTAVCVRRPRQAGRLASSFAGCLAGWALVGCGPTLPATFPVGGKVVDSRGAAIEQASVTFFTSQGGKSVRAEGVVGEGGRFALSTFRPGDGAVAGQHQVVIVPLPTADGPRQAARSIPARYENPETSGLTVEIEPRPLNEVTLVIEP
jgi:hypothetical protein